MGAVTETEVAAERDGRAVTRPVVLLVGFENPLEAAEVRGACKVCRLEVRQATPRPVLNDVDAALGSLDPAVAAVMVVVPEADGGVEAINIAHALKPELPIVAYTGRGQDDDAELKAAGADQVIAREELHLLLAELCAVLEVDPDLT